MTNKWSLTTDPESAEGRERKLKENHDYFGAMLASSHQASMMRFDPKSKGKALEIIKPHLTKRFDPQISFQMVDPKGPKLELGETDAGKVVADNIEKLEKSEDNLRKIKVSHAILAQRFNEKYFEKFKTKRDELVRKQRLHKATRWTVRTVIVGGSIAATVVTLGPGASAFALEPAFETIANRKKREDKDNMEKLKKQYKEESAIYKDYGEYSADWLDDRTVKQMSDLESSTYSIRSRSSEELEYVETGYVDTAETVAEDLAGFAIKDS